MANVGEKAEQLQARNELYARFISAFEAEGEDGAGTFWTNLLSHGKFASVSSLA